MSRKIVYPLILLLVVAGLYVWEDYNESIDPDHKIEIENTTRFESGISMYDDSFLPNPTTCEIIRHQFTPYHTIKSTNKQNGFHITFIHLI